MPKISSLLIPNAQYAKSKCSNYLKTLPVLLINCLSEYQKKNTKIGLCVSRVSSNSKGNCGSEKTDILKSLALIPQASSTPGFRELSAGQVSSPTSRRAESTSTGVSFRSVGDLLVEVNRQVVMVQRRP
ncbi:AC4 protein [Papaya leaf curl Lucknow virus 2]|uniref:AC4 protein n=1 Tax=Papaya leaf curl Lucknow virus 2 TaxID=3232064 RepID=A0A5P1I926_9GEMI|nr:AC4 protein [Papaya severe leaf curl virus]QBP05526.1 AC4 protein [Papaya severe leaf curl virus]